MAKTKAILEATGLMKNFKGLRATNDVNISVRDKTLHSVIGPNGAGKSTLFNLITGLFPPDAGKVVFDGRDITGMPIDKTARIGIARTFQITSIFPALSVLENVRLATQIATRKSLNMVVPKDKLKPARDAALNALDRVGLANMANMLASALAHSDRRRLEIAMALGLKPRLLLLDEPTAGNSMAETEKIAGLIHDLSRDTAVLLVEHDMDVVMKVSDEITVLNFGSVIANGTPAEIQSNKEVQRAYLGGAE